MNSPLIATDRVKGQVETWTFLPRWKGQAPCVGTKTTTAVEAMGVRATRPLSETCQDVYVPGPNKQEVTGRLLWRRS